MACRLHLGHCRRFPFRRPATAAFTFAALPQLTVLAAVPAWFPADCLLAPPEHCGQPAMRTRASRHPAAAAATPGWADLPTALWEAIADCLPAADIMSLRQAWRGATQLGHARLFSAACSAAEEELRCFVARAITLAFLTATGGMVRVL